MTRAPNRGNNMAFDRATRLWRMSPVMTTVTFFRLLSFTVVESRARRSSIVRKVEQRLRRMLVHSVARIQHGQAGHASQQFRSTAEVVPQDDRFRTERPQRQPVSFRDSPFSIEEDLSLTSVVVAPRLFAASSKEVRVLVLDS